MTLIKPLRELFRCSFWLKMFNICWRNEIAWKIMAIFCGAKGMTENPLKAVNFKSIIRMKINCVRLGLNQIENIDCHMKIQVWQKNYTAITPIPATGDWRVCEKCQRIWKLDVIFWTNHNLITNHNSHTHSVSHTYFSPAHHISNSMRKNHAISQCCAFSCLLIWWKWTNNGMKISS